MSRCPAIDRKNRRCLRSEGHFGLHTYKRLKVQGAKAERERDDLDRFRDAVKLAAGGYCEGRRFSSMCTGVGVEAHHVWPEDRDRGLHDPRRGKWLCRPCHNAVHSWPLKARRAGLLRAHALGEAS